MSRQASTTCHTDASRPWIQLAIRGARLLVPAFTKETVFVYFSVEKRSPSHTPQQLQP